MPRLGWHAAQSSVGLRNRALLIVRQIAVPLKQVARRRLLLRSHVLEGLHPVENLGLLLRRLAVEVAQTIKQVVLLFRRKIAETRILFELLLLLLRRQSHVFSEPIAAMRTGTVQMGLIASVGALRRSWRRTVHVRGAWRRLLQRGL